MFYINQTCKCLTDLITLPLPNKEEIWGLPDWTHSTETGSWPEKKQVEMFKMMTAKTQYNIYVHVIMLKYKHISANNFKPYKQI